MSRSRYWQAVGIAGAVVLADQISKQFFVAESVLNAGVAFGWFSDWPLVWALLLGVGWSGGVLVSVGISRSWTWSAQRWLVAFWAAAFSNLLDRWWWGGVRDPLWFSWWGGGGRNNVADWVIFFSAIALLWYALRNEVRQARRVPDDSHSL